MRTVCLLLLALFAVLPIDTATADAAAQITGLHVGFGGFCKLGFWTPAVVDLEGGPESFSGRIEIDVPDSDGVTVTYSTPHAQPVEMESGKRRSVSLLVKLGRAEAQLVVRMVGSSGEVVERPFLATSASDPQSGRAIVRALAGTTRLFVVVGRPVGLAEAMQDNSIRKDVATQVASIDDPSPLAKTWQGYDGVDAVVLSAGLSDSPIGQLSSNQREALLRWVVLGGRVLVVTSGEAATLLEEEGALAEFLPGRFVGTHSLRQGSAIEAFCDSQYPIKVRGGVLGINVPRIESVAGRIEVFEGNRPSDLPLLVREIRGLGEITYIGFDLSSPPLAEWAGRAQLFRRLLGTMSTKDIEFVEKASSGLTSLGYDDLTGQLRASLDEFHGIQSVPFALVAALAVIYIALLGPVDYYLVRHRLARPMLTWITLPIWIATFSLIAWSIADRSKDDTVHANSVELVDFDISHGIARGVLWMHVFSPRLDSMDFELDVRLPGSDRTADAQSLFGWLGLPGDALGGMQRYGDETPLKSSYGISADGRSIFHLPTAKWSTKSLSAKWFAQSGRSIIADLGEESDGRLTGQVENTLGFTLERVRLIHGRWAWHLGNIEPNAVVDLEDAADPVSIGTSFSRRSSLGFGHDSAGESGAAGADTEQILDRIMWYELAGGASATGLIHRYLAEYDMSHLIAAGRAVLVATCQAAGTQVLSDGKPIGQDDDRSLVVCRFVLSVRGQE